MTGWTQILKQIGVVLVGLLLAGVMVALGVWQLSVYQSQGREEAQKRAAQPAVAVTSVAPPGRQVTDEAYGRTVRFTGRYERSLQTYIAVGDEPGRYRVLTGLRLSGGGVLPVVRGVVTGKQAPEPPRRTVTQTGVLLPSEGTGEQADPSAEPTTIALASLAQRWKGTLVNGYATLSAPEAKAQSLQPAEVALPSSHGRLRNGFYALQWWVFAAFAVLMGFRMARDIGLAGDGEAVLIGGDPSDRPDRDRPDRDEPDSDEPDRDQPDRDQPDRDQPDRDQPDRDQPDRDQPDRDQPDSEESDRHKSGGHGSGGHQSDRDETAGLTP